MSVYLSPIGPLRIECQDGALHSLTYLNPWAESPATSAHTARRAGITSRATPSHASAVRAKLIPTPEASPTQVLAHPFRAPSGALEPTKLSDDAVVALTSTWLDAYFAGENPSVYTLPLAPQGSAFRIAVWEALLAVPYGSTNTYGELARALPGKASARAVGGALHNNPIPVIIPCHRIIGSGGALTGYNGGMERKVWLLAHEGVDVKQLRWPRSPLP